MITTHVLDIARGCPATGVAVVLETRQHGEWAAAGRGTTDENGRLMTLMEGRPLVPGTYRLTFDIGAYHRGQGLPDPFFPEVKVVFIVRDVGARVHVPLLVSPFGYSTYRGV
jgi:5-hydroxyisourate hydrolase